MDHRNRWFSALKTSIHMVFSSQPCLMKPEGTSKSTASVHHTHRPGLFQAAWWCGDGDVLSPEDIQSTLLWKITWKTTMFNGKLLTNLTMEMGNYMFKRLHNYGKLPCSIGKVTLSMAIFTFSLAMWVITRPAAPVAPAVAGQWEHQSCARTPRAPMESELERKKMVPLWSLWSIWSLWSCGDIA